MTAAGRPPIVAENGDRYTEAGLLMWAGPPAGRKYYTQLCDGLTDAGRWVIRSTADDGTAIVVQVVNGEIVVAAPRGPVGLSPRDLQRLRQVLAEACAKVIWTHGDW